MQKHTHTLAKATLHNDVAHAQNKTHKVENVSLAKARAQANTNKHQAQTNV